MIFSLEKLAGKKKKAGLTLSLLLLVAAPLSIMLMMPLQIVSSEAKQPQSKFESDQSDNFQSRERIPSSETDIKLSFAPIVRAAAPAVVNVYVSHKEVQTQFRSPLLNDPVFRHFFGDKLGRNRSRMKNSLGSGVILRSNGIVVTNFHVIKGGENGEIKVALQDKREFIASIILKDEQTDLAVLKINNDQEEQFPFLEFEDSDALNVGDLVLAIGNPFGVGQTVTSGIVSALARTRVGASDFQSFIQTDAAINPGNSGGALIDMHGRLVGINTAIYSRSGGSNGIGFAIPSNMVRLIVRSALEGTKVARPWFGAKLQPLTSDIANSIGLDRPSGALISRIYDASPAKIAGLKNGDVILKIETHDVDDPRSFHYRFATMGTKGRAKLTLYRRGKIFEKEITLIKAPFTPAPNKILIRGRNPFSGSKVANLSPGLSEELDIDDVSGVVIFDVAQRSFASSVGFRPNDIILSLNNTPVLSVDELSASVSVNHRLWRIEIKRANRILRLVLPGNN